jgi:hypothetical protein
MHRENPIKEKVDRSVFTDREDVFARLRQWLGWVENHVGTSVGLIGHRRVGKTAILYRLYNDLFWQQGMIIPFYFAMERKPIWIKDLAVNYFTTFAKQYIAFRLQIPELVEQEVTLEDLQPYLGALGNEVMTQEIERFPRAGETTSPALLFGRAIDFPSTLAVRHRQRVVVIFDEFQYMDEYVCTDAETKNPVPRYSGAFSSVCEYLDAPMLVAGSQVSLTELRTLNGGLRGRFDKWRLGPLTLEDGTELALRLARYHDLDLTAKAAYEISRLTGGHPFYIHCLVCSNAPDKRLTDPDSLEAVLDYELKRGKIWAFWNEHFGDHAGLLGDRDVLAVLFAVLHWEETASPEEKEDWDGIFYPRIAAEVGLTEEETLSILYRLRDADLIEESSSWGFFHGLSDPLLGQCLRLRHGASVLSARRRELEAQATQHFREQIAVLESTVASLRGQLRDLLGRDAELAVQRMMRQGFRGQTVDGSRFFHRMDRIALPRFTRVGADYVVTAGGEEYQLDNVGTPERPEREATWVTEQKNWEKRVGVPAARKFARAAEAYRTERGLKQVVAWLYGRAGFTTAARTFLEAEGILYSDREQLLDLAEELGLVGV